MRFFFKMRTYGKPGRGGKSKRFQAVSSYLKRVLIGRFLPCFPLLWGGKILLWIIVFLPRCSRQDLSLSFVVSVWQHATGRCRSHCEVFSTSWKAWCSRWVSHQNFFHRAENLRFMKIVEARPALRYTHVFIRNLALKFMVRFVIFAGPILTVKGSYKVS